MTAKPDSPCIDVCVIDPSSRLCRACLRTIDEITAWGRMTPEARREVMATLPDRAPQLSPAAPLPSLGRK